MRIRVADILEMLAQGASATEILSDFPDLETEDIQACLLFAAKRDPFLLSFPVCLQRLLVAGILCHTARMTRQICYENQCPTRR
jgi:hypothetical protein